jgi:tRNA A-37 threonylcarbamoyl transferase component Bud32
MFHSKIALENGHSYSKRVILRKDCVETVYEGLNPAAWQRVLEITRTFADAGIGPRVISVNDVNETSFMLEKIVMAENLPKKSYSMELDKLVEKMHNLGICHGDVLGNVGWLNGNLVAIDVDTAFKFNQSDELVLEIAKSRFSFKKEDSCLEEFMIENDRNSVKIMQ